MAFPYILAKSWATYADKNMQGSLLVDKHSNVFCLNSGSIKVRHPSDSVRLSSAYVLQEVQRVV